MPNAWISTTRQIAVVRHLPRILHPSLVGSLSYQARNHILTHRDERVVSGIRNRLIFESRISIFLMDSQSDVTSRGDGDGDASCLGRTSECTGGWQATIKTGADNKNQRERLVSCSTTTYSGLCRLEPAFPFLRFDPSNTVDVYKVRDWLEKKSTVT